jgi:transposase
MSYSSSLTDAEWEIFEPLLLEILPKKKRTRPCDWSKRELIDGMLYQLKNGCNWKDLPKEFPPYSTVYWHYKQWRNAGVFEPTFRTSNWHIEYFNEAIGFPEVADRALSQ